MTEILVIEDNATNMRLTRDVLTRAGYAVTEATTASAGIALAVERGPALVVMDIQLPGTDGLTATRTLKADPRTASIPVVALTAHAMRGDEARMLAAGCDRYLAKPLRYKELLGVVAELVGPVGNST